MIGNEQRTEAGISLDELVSKIESAPSSWVLILGDEISFNKEVNRRKRLSRLAKEAVETERDSHQEIYEAIRAQSYMKLSGALFGDIWDGATFLDEDQERKLKRRQAYAQRLGTRNTLNLCGTEAEGLQDLLEKFNGLIITTCQDESIEAAWEYGKSLPADNNVYTPYELTTSQVWSRWLDTEEGTGLQQDWPFDKTVLVKLFGSVSNPNRMLLSQEDIQSYYPASESQDGNSPAEGVLSKDVNTVRLLERIFREKNLLFLGVEFEGSGLLASATGILQLLKNTGRERYALPSANLSEYGIKPVNTKYEPGKVIRALADHSFNPPETQSDQAANPENGNLSWEEVQRLFFWYYIRRSPESFLQKSPEDSSSGTWQGRELEILRKDILGFQNEGEASGTVWTREAIIQLAFAANNLADFYDLAYAFKQEEEKLKASGETDLSLIPLLLLKSRLTERSLRLHKILSTYKSAFPLSFLGLLPYDNAVISGIPEQDLALCTQEGQEKWIKSGIQLVNSGIYVNHNERNNLYGRMIYADALMKFAGSHPCKERFQKEIEQLRHQARDSYFYPLNSVHIQFDVKDFKAETVNTILAAMLGNLYVILRDKVGGYQQIHATLQTETPNVLNIMWQIEDPSLRWQPGLLYFLLYESRTVPDPEDTLEKCSNLMEQLAQKLDAARGMQEEWKRLFCMKLMVMQAEILIRSQSQKAADQQQSQKLCEVLYKEVNAVHCAQKIWKGEMPESVFEMYVRTCFLEGKSYGRESTIVEIKRCDKKQAVCSEQDMLLEKMQTSLKNAEDFIVGWEKANPGSYCWELRGELYRLQGEHYFKRSQYYMENRRYGAPFCSEEIKEDKEYSSYGDAENKYSEALSIYQKDTIRYKIPLADTLRSLADVYCEWGKNYESIRPEEESCKREKNREQFQRKCYDALIRSYSLYRGNSDLHGIADVLQSMGNAVGPQKTDKNARSRLSFYKAAVDIYTELGASWSKYVAASFLSGAIGKPNSNAEPPSL